MISFSNVVRVFKQSGFKSGFKHVYVSIGNLFVFGLQAVSRVVSKASRLGTKNTDRYLHMQKSEYNLMARQWSPKNRDPVVGWWDEHNTFKDYDVRLFRGLDTANSLALEYGCGPGRNIQRFWQRFRRIDGVDISEVNIRKAKKFLNDLGITKSKLWANDGVTIECEDSYDVVFSVITLQHIASHQVRFRILEQMFGALRPGGTLTFQMGFGSRENSVAYSDDFYEATSTNGGCDVRVDSETQILEDLESIGFVNVDFEFGDSCQDLHEKWIWVMATKPAQPDPHFD
jgi:SAM-dependent methyltransferase